jgi:hypothetical protein
LSDQGEQHVISFGRGVRLMSEEYYIRELRPYGIDKVRAFRALCRAICCPIIVLGRVGFVDPATFQVCMKNLSMPGRKDFLGPNSHMKLYRKGRTQYRNRVDPKEIYGSWKSVIRAITDSRKIRGLSVQDADRVAIRSAAEELTRFVLRMIPSGEQEQANGNATAEGD